MFSRLLKSKARKSLLTIFLNESRQKYYLRELAERINYSPGSLQRELNSLVESDLLISEKMGNLRFFSLNTKCALLKELRQYLAIHAGHIPGAGATKSPEPIEPQKALRVAPPDPQAKTLTSQQKSRPPTQSVIGTHSPTQAPTHAPTHPTIQTPIHSKTQVSSFEKPEIKKPIFTKPILIIPVNPTDYPNQKSSFSSPSQSQSPSPHSPSTPPVFTYAPTPHDPDNPPDDITLHIE